jgi:hypothetical protein
MRVYANKYTQFPPGVISFLYVVVPKVRRHYDSMLGIHWRPVTCIVTFAHTLTGFVVVVLAGAPGDSSCRLPNHRVWIGYPVGHEAIGRGCAGSCESGEGESVDTRLVGETACSGTAVRRSRSQKTGSVSQFRILVGILVSRSRRKDTMALKITKAQYAHLIREISDALKDDIEGGGMYDFSAPEVYSEHPMSQVAIDK